MRRSMSSVISGMAIVTVLAGGAVANAKAEEFYKGKTIRLILSTGPGGGYATYALAVVRHLGRHIPGNPKFIRQHRQGAGGIVAANYLYNLAPKDGTVIATIHRGAVSTSPLFGEKGIKYDPTKFGWLGSPDRGTSVCVAWHASPIKSFKDVFTKTMIVGGVGPGSDTDNYPILFNNLLGTKFKLVTGYPSGTAVNLAYERGEVYGRCGWSWSSIQSTQSQWLREKKIKVLVEVAMRHNPSLPAGVPLIETFVKGQDQRDILELWIAPQEMSRPMLTPPGLPADRLKTLQDAFDATMKDTGFIADAKRQKLSINPMSGKEIEQLIARLYAKPKNLIEQAKTAALRSDRIEVTVKKLPTVKIETTIGEVKRGGRALAFKAKAGKTHQVRVSGGKTKITIGGKAGKRSALKAGMKCTITYSGNKSTAKTIAC